VSADSPAVIIFDEQGNPVGVMLDGVVYRLQTETIITDNSGNGPAAVKPPNTAAVASDPALVVAISPSSPISTSTDGYATNTVPSYTDNTFNSLSLTTAGALRVDGSAVTQPVSGTVVANQGTPNTLANAWPIELTDGYGNGPVAVTRPYTAAIAAEPGLVVSFSPNSPITTTAARPGTNTTSSVAASVTSVTLLLSNSARLGATVYNDSSALLYIQLGDAASTSDFTIKLFPLAYYEIPFLFTGEINGVWSLATGGFARISELTP